MTARLPCGGRVSTSRPTACSPPRSYLTLAAYDQFVLGRPRIDEIEIRFIPDVNTLSANALAGSVDMVMGRSLSTEQALQMKNSWQGGKADIAFRTWLEVHAQYI